MKNLIPFFAFSLFSLLSNGQIVLTDASQNDISNDTLRVYGQPSDDYIKANIFFSNETDQTAYVFVRKEEIDIQEGSSVTFCWNDFCFTPVVSDVEKPLALEPGESSSDTDFYSEIYPEGATGESIVQFEFYSDRDDFEPVVVTIVYVVSSSTHVSESHSFQWSISDPYPNPARNFTRIDYHIPSSTNDARLVLRDLVGKQVLDVPLSSEKNQIQIPTNQLNNGLYIYSLIYREKIYESKRLLIAN
ncbi:MAG: T9SS type A sorting domain-containing protein [Bacteroidales bacterium]